MVGRRSEGHPGPAHLWQPNVSQARPQSSTPFSCRDPTAMNGSGTAVLSQEDTCVCLTAGPCPAGTRERSPKEPDLGQKHGNKIKSNQNLQKKETIILQTRGCSSLPKMGKRRVLFCSKVNAGLESRALKPNSEKPTEKKGCGPCLATQYSLPFTKLQHHNLIPGLITTEEQLLVLSQNNRKCVWKCVLYSAAALLSYTPYC